MIRRSLQAVILACSLASGARAVIVYDPQGRNLTAPPVPLLDAWNLQGQYGNFNGTPISPSQFIVARHIGGGPGDFYYRNQAFTAVSAVDIAGTDLRIWTIDTQGGTRTFSAYAPLYDPAIDGSEIGKPLVVFGRGSQRGAALLAPIDPGATLGPTGAARPTVLTGGGPAVASLGVPGPTPQPSGEMRGWRWGFGDGVQSWGQNVVDAEAADNTYGDLLSFDFDGDATRVANEAILSVGDSSGGVFIRSGGVWKLAGVNLGVDGNWSLSQAGQYEGAALFDARGLWAGTAASNGQVAYDANLVPISSYSTRIAAHLTAIRAITGLPAGDNGGNGSLVPEPTMCAVAGAAALLLRRPRRAVNQ